MRIGIDARMMGKGFGIARYVEQLVLHLLSIDTENEYVLFLQNDNWNEIAHNLPGVKKVLDNISWYTLQEQLMYTKIIQKEKVDLMHFPHWNIPYFYHNPYVVTIHDLIMFHYPRAEATTLGPVKFWLKDQAHRMLLRKVTGQAKHILTTSEFTKQDIHETLNVPLKKMTVTYQAPFMSSQPMEIDRPGILERYKISKPYVLYVGSAYPHKNLERLLEAWKVFEQKYGFDYQLVLAGKESYFYKRLQSIISHSVICTGFVPDEELSFLYKNASLYVFPSLYEGFGLPPLEAMAHGVPVISSNRSCLPEVLQNAALYFDPENITDMAQALDDGLHDEKLRQDLKEKSISVLQKYSWEILATQTLSVYKSTLDSF